MRIVLTIDTNFPRWLRRLVAISAVPALALAAATVHADVPLTEFKKDDPLSAKAMNDNFNALKAAVTPVGTIIAFAGKVCPNGYLEANGTPTAKADHPDLCNLLGTTWGPETIDSCTLPPLRNRFLRGASAATDNNGGATVDVGAYQTDGFKAHTHTYNLSTQMYATDGSVVQLANDPVSGTNHYGTSSVGEDETRPKSYGVLWCVKY